MEKEELDKLTIEADLLLYLERGVRGDRSHAYPDWVYEAAEAIRHQNENIPWLPDLLKILGWQGGTIHEALKAVGRLVEAADKAEAERKASMRKNK